MTRFTRLPRYKVLYAQIDINIGDKCLYLLDFVTGFTWFWSKSETRQACKAGFCVLCYDFRVLNLNEGDSK